MQYYPRWIQRESSQSQANMTLPNMDLT